MERDALAELSREQLVELVLALAAEVAELKAQLGQPPKTPGNSSVPPSVGFKANRAERRTWKRHRGHDGISPSAAAGRDRAVSTEHLSGVWRPVAAGRATAGRAES